jgi:hypothetical protein
MNNDRLLGGFIFFGCGLVSCQDRTVVQGTEVSRAEAIGVMTPVTLDAGFPAGLFDSPASYRDYQVRSGTTGIPTVRPAQGPAPATSGQHADGGADHE